MRRGRRLTGEDERLWATVARQALPLKGKRHPALPEAEAPALATVKAMPAPKPPTRGGTAERAGIADRSSDAAAADFGAALRSFQSPVQAALPVRRQTQHPIERPTKRKIARGRIAIEARLDLHEMTQGVAHDQLMRFLRQAQAMGLRHILVITGRGGGPGPGTGGGAGFGSRGVLRRVVPLWFSGPEFRPLVSGFESAERHHGGDGAFYVRVRRFG